MLEIVFRPLLGFMFIVLGFTVVGFAQSETVSDFSDIEIKNFGQMDERFYRGAQPEQDQFQSLADLGINTVINLRDGAKDYEKETVESLGMKYVAIPMDDNEYPPEEAVQKFLSVVNDPSTGKFFVHCKGGKHRAGAMGAVYRYTNYGWDYDRVYREMKQYKFYTFFGKFGVIKRFVKDYGEKLKSEVDVSVGDESNDVNR